jgi:hypothetical protein
MVARPEIPPMAKQITIQASNLSADFMRNKQSM